MWLKPLLTLGTLQAALLIIPHQHWLRTEIYILLFFSVALGATAIFKKAERRTLPVLLITATLTFPAALAGLAIARFLTLCFLWGVPTVARGEGYVVSDKPIVRLSNGVEYPGVESLLFALPSVAGFLGAGIFGMHVSQLFGRRFFPNSIAQVFPGLNP